MEEKRKFMTFDQKKEIDGLFEEHMVKIEGTDLWAWTGDYSDEKIAEEVGVAVKSVRNFRNKRGYKTAPYRGNQFGPPEMGVENALTRLRNDITQLRQVVFRLEEADERKSQYHENTNDRMEVLASRLDACDDYFRDYAKHFREVERRVTALEDATTSPPQGQTTLDIINKFKNPNT